MCYDCLYLDATDGTSQHASLVLQAEECGEFDTTLEQGLGELLVLIPDQFFADCVGMHLLFSFHKGRMSANLYGSF